jgi:hypothetical protein
LAVSTDGLRRIDRGGGRGGGDTGFPRGNPAVPRNVALIKQYNGTSSEAIVAINDLTGDIVTIYTLPRADDWAGCVQPL